MNAHKRHLYVKGGSNRYMNTTTQQQHMKAWAHLQRIEIESLNKQMKAIKFKNLDELWIFWGWQLLQKRSNSQAENMKELNGVPPLPIFLLHVISVQCERNH